MNHSEPLRVELKITGEIQAQVKRDFPHPGRNWLQKVPAVVTKLRVEPLELDPVVFQILLLARNVPGQEEEFSRVGNCRAQIVARRVRIECDQVSKPGIGNTFREAMESLLDHWVAT